MPARAPWLVLVSPVVSDERIGDVATEQAAREWVHWPSSHQRPSTIKPEQRGQVMR
jgi:hypothetical protein